MKNVKGTYDYLPKEQIVREKVIDTLKNAFRIYGFNPIETPILCMQEILASKYAGGAEILKEIYTLSDQGKRELGLRYDLTVPLSRFIGMNKNELLMPFKKYEIGKVFRDGPVKLGRKREFYQADVDVVGIKSFYSEIEFFQMIDYIANELGIKVAVKYNNRALLVQVLELLEVPKSISSSIILTIDKLEKINRDEVIQELLDKGMSNSNAEELLRIMEMSFCEILELIKERKDEEEIEQFVRFKEVLESIKPSINTKYVFSPSLARGLEVYTGTIWEVFVNDDSMVTSSIGAGGRYDKIIGQFLGISEECPAVGMTFGVDVLMEIIKEKQQLDNTTVVDYLIIPMKGTELESLKLTNELRKLGIKADMDMSGKRIRKVMNYANKMNIMYVTIIGEDEVKKGFIKVKNMKTGIEMEFGINDYESISNFILKDEKNSR
ncbi:histidine--tRNA ligase [Vallitalea guaymasensis]|uniref:histidine--tRNA ligase n=1 Tax=Vallitalea guaymasensis TaxID=1185412 RepID=UPI0023533A8B|nr:histidine--tRNA ligase [Vallitalea guaymasensis]